ncbi:hypothetical protein Tco_0114968 [Tanacetum coccineum]
MVSFPRLDELAVAANSWSLFDGMMLHFERETTIDLEFAADLHNSWVQFIDRTNNRKLFIRQEYEAKDAAARYGYLFSQATAEILCQAEAEIRNQGVSAVTDPAGIDSAVREPAGIVSADGVSTGSPSAVSDSAGSHPADCFPPAGSVEPTDESNPAVVHLCLLQCFFTSSSYDDDFRATLTNLAPAVEVNPVPTKRVHTIHPQSQILGDLASQSMTRSRAQKSKFGESALIGYIQDQQRTNHTDQLHCLRDATILQSASMENLVLSCGKHAIGTKWFLKTSGARGIVVRNNARLVAQGHRQEGALITDEVLNRGQNRGYQTFLAFDSYMRLSGISAGVKSAFLYGELKQKLLSLSLKAVKILTSQSCIIDKPLFIRKIPGIFFGNSFCGWHHFGSTNKAWCDEFEVLMKGEFEMSAMGEMTFFLGLQVKQLPDGLFISQDKYVKDMLTKFGHGISSRPDIMFAVSACSRHQVTPLTSHLNAVKKIFKYLKGQPKLGLWYPKDSPFQLEAYSDSDYAGSHGDRKSTTGGCQFLGRRLISWQCKKQTIVATSSTEAEYVAAASCCAQRTKHIEIRHHFIRDANEKNLIQVLKIHTDDNVADLLTKAFDGPRFASLIIAGSSMFLLVVIPPAASLVSAGSSMFAGYSMFLLVVIPPAASLVSAGSSMFLLVVIPPAASLVSAGSSMVLLVVILPAGRMVSAGWSMVLLVVIFPAARMVSAGWSMVLLVVIFPAARLVSAGWSMVLLVVIFPAARLVSAGCTMVLLEVIVPAGFFVPAGSYGLCCCIQSDCGTLYLCLQRVCWANIHSADCLFRYSLSIVTAG